MRRPRSPLPRHLRLRLGIVAFLASILVFASLADAEVIQRGGVRVAFDGQIYPRRLPRTGTTPVKVTVATKISSVDPKSEPQLTRIQIAINSNGHIDPTGLPICEVSDIQPSTTGKALEACPGSKVGEGSFSATVAVSKKVAFPTAGKLIAFNGVYEGRPAILAHVYGTDPLPTSFTLPFVIGQERGTYGTTLTATLPAAQGNFVNGIELTLHRTFDYRGKARSYASAGCPAPQGSPGAVFSFARATYSFAGGRRLTSVLTRTCKAR
jgi:hypothetical protein